VIITVAEYKSIYGGNQPDAYYESLLLAAQDAVEWYCDRRFDAADYAEQVLVCGSNRVAVKQYPIQVIQSIAAIKQITPVDTSGNVFSTAVSNLDSIVVVMPNGNTVSVDISNINTIGDVVDALNTAGYEMAIDADDRVWPKAYILCPTAGAIEYAAPILDISAAIDILDMPILWLDRSLWGKYVIRYRAGYEADDMPYALKQIVADMVNSMITTITTQGGGILTHEKITNYEYTISPDRVTRFRQLAGTAYADALESFRRKPLVGLWYEA
jgi:hypothetical protein